MTKWSSNYPTPRDWKDLPDVSTPVNAAALEDLEWRAQRGDEFISDADVTGAVSVMPVNIDYHNRAIGT